MAIPNIEKVNIFIAYAREDEEYRKELNKHLTTLGHSYNIELWDESKILPGEDNHMEVKKKLSKANIILLLLSIDFLASDTLMQQLQLAFEHRNKSQTEVVPIIVRACNWKQVPELRPLRVIFEEQALASASVDKRDELYLKIVDQLKNIIRKRSEKEKEIQRERAANEEALWEKVVKRNLVEGYERYMKEYPNGSHYDNAQTNIDYLRKRIHKNLSSRRIPIPNTCSIRGGKIMIKEYELDDDVKLTELKLGDFEMMIFPLIVEEFNLFVAATGYQTDADKKTNNYGSNVWDSNKWIKKENVNWKCDVRGNLHTSSSNDHPVIHVSWNDTVAYAKWLSEQTGRTWRLPTEAEWEYAAKAGQNFEYAGSDDLSAVGWYEENAGSKTHPVGQKQPNGYGLYDMSGNVWEWCINSFGNKHYMDNNNKESHRVSRGGGWCNSETDCWILERNASSPSYRSSCLGFRLVIPNS